MHSMSYSSGQQQQQPSSSSSLSRNSKLDQIIQNFYSKTAQIIIQARNTDKSYGKRTSRSSSNRKINKWFNIATDDVDVLREDLKFWRTMAVQSTDEIPHMIIDIYLDTSRLAQNHQQQSLVLADDNLRWTKVELKSPTSGLSADKILIESWELSLNRPFPDHPIDLPNLYKRSIVFFRSLHSFVRLLPSYELYRKIHKQQSDTKSLSMGYRLTSSTVRAHPSEIALSSSVLESDARSVTKTHEFKEIVTPIGTFKLNVTYRRNCDFRVEDSERDLSAQFIEMDEQFFTPTMMQYSNRQRPMSMYASISSNNNTSPEVGLGIRDKTSPSSIQQETQQQQQERRPRSQQQSPTYPIATTTPKDVSPREINNSFSPTNTNNNRYSSPITTASSAAIGSFQRMESPSFVSSSSFSSSPRRASAPFISPFKSPSLSSSPQAGAIAIHPRQQSSHIRTNESGSFGKKLEFSSSFDRYKTSPTHRERRGSKASEQSLLYFSESENNNNDLEDFVKFVGAHQQLKLFQKQQQSNNNLLDESIATDNSMTSSLYRSKQALSHFQNLRDTHHTLSESISTSQAQPEMMGVSPVSSTSSTGKYQPIVPSPLHTEQMSSKPIANTTPTTIMPRSYPQTRTLASTSRALLNARKSIHSPLDLRNNEEEEEEDDDIDDDYGTRDLSAYSTYPTDRHYDMRHLRSGITSARGEERRAAKGSRSSSRQSSSTATSSESSPSLSLQQKTRDSTSGNIGGGVNEIENKKKIPIVLESRIAAPIDIQQQQQQQQQQQKMKGSSSMLDDDDSLVFKMSELGYDGSLSSPLSEPLIFNRTVTTNNNDNSKKKMKEEEEVVEKEVEEKEEEEEEKGTKSSGVATPLTQSRLLFDAW